jgi:hypothetical protein
MSDLLASACSRVTMHGMRAPDETAIIDDDHCRGIGP